MRINTKYSKSWESLIIIWIGFFLLGFFCSFYNAFADLDAVAIIVFFSIPVIMSMLIRGNNNKQRIILIISYFVSIFLLFFDRFSSPLEIGDAEGFHISALSKASGERAYKYGGLYTDIVGIIYRLFKDSRLMGQYFNVLIFVSTLAVVLDILSICDIDENKKNISLALIAFNPHLLMMIAILRRESIIVFLVAVSFKHFLLWESKQNTIELIKATLLCIFAAAFHSGVISLAFSYAFIYIMYNKDKKQFQFSTKSSIKAIACFLVFIVIYIYFNDLILDKFNHYTDFSDLNSKLDRKVGGSGYIVGFQINNRFLDFIVNTPIRCFYFLLSPMPWDWRNIGDVIAFVMSSVYYSFGYVIAFKSIKSKTVSSNRTIIIACLIIMLMFCIVFSWGTRNAGTAMRHRNKFVIPYIIMIALARNNNRNKAKTE